MIKKITLLGLLLLATRITHAQVGSSDKEDVGEIKKRTLLIATEEPSAKLSEKLKGDELASYEKDIKDYNAYIKETVGNFWKFNDKIEYKTRAEIDKLTKSKSKQYAYIEYSK